MQTWSRDTNSSLPFAVNVALNNISIVFNIGE